MVRIALMTALLEAVKFALNALPNVELVTLCTILFTRKFGWRESLPAVLLFALIESMWWGISIWTATYFYTWPFLVLLSAWTAKEDSLLMTSILSGVFGLLFGFLCALTTLVTAGFHAAAAWWIAGIPYDLIHGAANFVLCLLLYQPLSRALGYIVKEQHM